MKAIYQIFYFYVFISFSLCQKCPSNCVRENEEEEEECTGCKTGYYDISSNCQGDCTKCPDMKCDEQTGDCSEAGDCIDYTTYGPKCALNCVDLVSLCAKCHNDGTCFECSDKHYYTAQCSEKCTRCPGATCNFDGTCDTEADYCGDPTYYGDKCSTSCKNNNREYCAECKKTGGICTSCSGPHYGNDCQGDCSNCPEGKCDMDGTCTQSEDTCGNPAYTGTKCNEKCSDAINNCVYCLMNTIACNECSTSFYGTKCEGTCLFCPGTTCDMSGICSDKNGNCEGETMKGDKCDTPCSSDGHENCEKCQRNGICLKCADNKYKGDYCDVSCSSCPGGTCYVNGNCTDQNKNCDDKTKKGVKCDISCSSEGHDNCEECNRDGICSKCKDNKYKGDYCEESCANCPDGFCLPNGDCLDPSSNCKNNLYYGIKCDQPCNGTNEFCETCNRDGECLTCKDQLRYGSDCSGSCQNCPGGICEFDEGTCINEGDCKDYKFYQDKCQLPCSNISEFCDTCFRVGKCKGCTDESHYGNSCIDICNTCPTPSCDIEGICKDHNSNCANNSYYGESCESKCNTLSTYCDKCTREKICIECSDRHYYGSKCEDMCSTCPDGLCANNGTCDNTKANCKDDASYGPECKDECTKIGPNCLKCNRDETCSVCVNATFYGKKCENFCSHCPNNECYIDGTCVNTDEDCPDPHFYGNDCKKSCKDINGNCDTCSRKEICTNCTTEEYWGNKCEKHCDYCPENRCYINGICVDKNNNCIGSNFTGERCDEPCTDINNNCLFCDRKKICFECKNKSMFGDDCSTPCDRCPGNPSICDNKGICNDTKTPCKDPSYTGLNCSLLCKDQHPKGNCKTCDRNYICTECYNKEFYGENVKHHVKTAQEHVILMVYVIII